MAKKKDIWNNPEGYTGSMSSWGGTGGSSGSSSPLPSATSYEPFQPTVEPYVAGGMSAPDPMANPTAQNPGAQLSSNARRTAARQNYSFDAGDVNRRLLEAAMNYGNAPEVIQYGTGDDSSYNAKVNTNPNSTWGNISRFFDESGRNIEEDLNNRNSFFSGAHLDQKQKLGEDVNRQRGQATMDWDSIMGDLNSQIMRSRAGRDQELGEADIMDMLAALEAQRMAGATGGAAAPMLSEQEGAPQDESFISGARGQGVPEGPQPWQGSMPAYGRPQVGGGSLQNYQQPTTRKPKKR